MKIAVAGATGYTGSRLVPILLQRGHEVVCLARTPARLDDRQWREQVEVRRADVLSTEDVTAVLLRPHGPPGGSRGGESSVTPPTRPTLRLFRQVWGA